MPERTWEDVGINIYGHSTGTFKTRCPGVDGNGCSSNQSKKDLSVDLEKGAWRCHNPGCEFKGFLNGTGNGQVRARASLDEKIYRKISPEDWLAATDELPPEARAYLHKRGFSDKTIAHFGLRWGKKPFAKVGTRWINGIHIPYPSKDPNERVIVNIKKRPLDKDDPMGMAGKEKGTDLAAELIYYNIRAALKAKTAVLTEGEYDVIALKEAGIDYGMSVPNGVPSDDPEKIQSASLEFHANCLESIKQIDHIIMFGDDDKPGRALIAEMVRRIGPEKCSYVEYPAGCKDANDVLLKLGPEGLRRVVERARPYPVTGLSRPTDMLQELLGWKKDGMPSGVSTGWAEVDNYWRPTEGQLTIVTGIPSMGKSSWLDALLINLYRLNGWKGVIFSPESFPSGTHLVKLMQILTGKTFDDRMASAWQAGRYPELEAMTEADIRAGVSELDQAFSFILPDLDGDGITLDRILDYTRAEVARRGVKMLVIDPWNEIEHLMPPGIREDQYVSKMLSKIRRFARRTGVHVFLVAHPKKMESGEIPGGYSISDSAAFANKADIGITYHVTDPTRGQAMLRFWKQRHEWTGKRGDVMVVFNKETRRFEADKTQLVASMGK